MSDAPPPGQAPQATQASPVSQAPRPAERKNLLIPNLERWPLDPDKPVIELIDVSVSFGKMNVLDGLNLKIAPGKTTVIVGRSGSGKSVLLKLMMGLLKPDRGKVMLFGRDLSQVSPLEILELRKRMGMLFQNYALFDALSVTDNVGFPLQENSKLPRRDITELANGLVQILGLTGSEKLLPAELSGGMRKRVSLARALVANPEVVLFDEPTTGLDPIMIEKVDEMIALAHKQYHITSAIISHDMASTARLADLVGFLHDGKIIFYGTYDEFRASQLAPVRTFVEGASTSRLGADSAASDEEEQTHKFEVPAGKTAAEQLTATQEPAVQLVGVYKQFGGKQVLRGIDLAIYPKLTTVLIGASGSGKSVIIKHIMGLFKPTSGEIKVFGENIVPMNDDEMNKVRSRFGLVFQHAALLDWLNVYDNVEFPLKERKEGSRQEIRERVLEILERLKITDIMHRMPGEISEGQKKRVGLARAIVMKPEILIYDEPTTGQDPLRTRDIDNMIEETQQRFDITSIVISHDMASTFRIAHMIAMIHQGEIAAYGTPAEIRASKIPEVQHFIHAGTV
jgi:ABC-type transporter Mla maintaining outer membrane lipid asymmetry ATPase subunit MlaF